MFKSIHSLLLFGVLSLSAWGQTSPADLKAFQAPSFQSIDLLVNYCHQNVPQKERARFYFAWISKNIRYDFSQKTDPDASSFKPELIFFNQKTTCYGYATLYEHLCFRSGIPNWLVTGYSNINGTLEHHAWNLIKVNQGWHFVDPTWGADFYMLDSSEVKPRFNAQYCANPQTFAAEHIPFDSMLTLQPSSRGPALADKFLDTEWTLDSTMRIWNSAKRGWEQFQSDTTAALELGNAQYLLIEKEMNKVAESFNAWMTQNQGFEKPISHKKAQSAVVEAEALRAKGATFRSMNLQLDQLWSPYNSANSAKLEQRNKFEGFDQMMENLIQQLKKQ